MQIDPQPQIILGTQSRSRRVIVDELAERFGFKYSAITADIDEQAIRRKDPRELVSVLAHAKAEAIVEKLRSSGALVTPGYLVTCDQVRRTAIQWSIGLCMRLTDFTTRLCTRKLRDAMCRSFIRRSLFVTAIWRERSNMW